jgi:hypothetical protein
MVGQVIEDFGGGQAVVVQLADQAGHVPSLGLAAANRSSRSKETMAEGIPIRNRKRNISSSLAAMLAECCQRPCEKRGI